MKPLRIQRRHIKGVQPHMRSDISVSKSKPVSVCDLHRVFRDKWSWDYRKIIFDDHRKGIDRFWIYKYLKYYYMYPEYYDK